MVTGPTQNVEVEAQSQWRASPKIAFAIKALAFLVPLLGAWFVVRITSPAFFRPAGLFGLALWIVQALVVGLFASRAIDTFSRRLLPLAALFRMSLVFPDHAPSRFRVALRSGSVSRLRRKTMAPPGAAKASSAQDFAETAVAMVAELSSHDRITRGHSERVRAYADLIAEEMDLPEADRIRLSWAALLHDLGKTQVPAGILNNTGRPTDSEWKTLAKHPAHAEELLAPLADWLGPWVGAATQHHERWDGDGYPAGLEGDQISLAGRITAVADAYDTMTSKRSYKRAINPEDARQELVACSGTQFDPAVVRAFLNVSLGRRWATGPLAFLAELPGIWSAGSSAIPAVTASMIVAGTLGAGAPPAPVTAATAELAFIEATQAPAIASRVTAATTSTTAASTTEPPRSVDSLPATNITQEATTILPTTALPTTALPTTALPTTTSTTSPPSATTTQVPTTTTAPPPPANQGVSDDEAQVENNNQVKILVLENDDINGIALDLSTLVILTNPEHAKMFWIDIDHIHYRSESGYEGTDQFQYEVCNIDGECDSGWVTITVFER